MSMDRPRLLLVDDDLKLCRLLKDYLEPLGLGVVMKAEHMCMTIRGVQSPGTKTTTSAMRGVFLDPKRRAREEFLHFIKDD